MSSLNKQIVCIKFVFLKQIVVDLF